MKQSLEKRSTKIAFMEILNGEAVEYHRLTGFTEFTPSKNPKEYTRQYLDETFERVDVVSYAPSIAFAFDAHSNNLVHKEIRKVFDQELIGDAAQRVVVIVDMADNSGIKRAYNVVPDNEAGSPDSYTYAGSFKANGNIEVIKVTSVDNFQTIKIDSEEAGA